MKRLRLALLITLSIVFLCGLLAVGWYYRELTTPVTHSRSDTYIDIPRGAGPNEIVAKLNAEGIIKREWPLLIYLKWTRAGSRLKAGEYQFASPITPLQVLQKLQEGEERLSKFTVIEGWTRWDIAAAMSRIPDLKLKDSDAALRLMEDTSSVRDLDPAATNLEGYLYPDTYKMEMDASASDYVAAMVARFRQEWKPEWSERSRALGLTPRQIITVASLIETEAKLAEERPVIASVIYNRLRRSIPLGVDSSIIYASKLAGKWRNDGKVYKSDIDRQSPYNTRIRIGLPPGPIASPSASSIEAALFPVETNFLYYVREPSRNDGAHNFYDNPTDFQRGVDALRNWERTRDAREAASQNGNVSTR